MHHLGLKRPWIRRNFSYIFAISLAELKLLEFRLVKDLPSAPLLVAHTKVKVVFSKDHMQLDEIQGWLFEASVGILVALLIIRILTACNSGAVHVRYQSVCHTAQQEVGYG